MPRKKLDIDPNQVQLLASAFCTNEEIAAKLGCSPDTLTRRFADPLKRGRDSAKASLRAKQFQLAMKGNVTLLIWLGKQYLGQSDKVDMTPIEGQSPRQHTVVFKRHDGKEKNH
jgi:hypothetical protein